MVFGLCRWMLDALVKALNPSETLSASDSCTHLVPRDRGDQLNIDVHDIGMRCLTSRCPSTWSCSLYYTGAQAQIHRLQTDRHTHPHTRSPASTHEVSLRSNLSGHQSLFKGTILLYYTAPLRTLQVAVIQPDWITSPLLSL